MTKMEMHILMIEVSIPHRFGTTIYKAAIAGGKTDYVCQFLIGSVQQLLLSVIKYRIPQI